MRSEFEFIHNIKERFQLKVLGDDCAVLPSSDDLDLVVTADLLVEDIDFRLDWSTPEQIGHKALAVSLSDIAAMGAAPNWAMTTIGVPERLWKTDFLDRFYDGWHSLARAFGVSLVGGDVSRSSDNFFVDSIVGGYVDRGTAIFRSGAKAGDAIFVTNHLGGSSGGLSLFEGGRRLDRQNEVWAAELLIRHINPQPQLDAANYLHSHRLAVAMIDLSDGLASDLQHIAKASDLGAEIIDEDIPIDPNLSSLGIPHDKQLALALYGGEDFELLFAVPPAMVDQIPPSQRFESGVVTFRRIGTFTDKPGRVEIVDRDHRRTLEPFGYRHF